MNDQRIKRPDNLEALYIAGNTLMVFSLFLAIYFGWANFRLLEYYFMYGWVKIFAIAVPFILFLMILAFLMYRYNRRFMITTILICACTLYFLTEKATHQLVAYDGVASSLFFLMYIQLLIIIIVGLLTASYLTLCLRRIMTRFLNQP
jgi:hypothetical protein